MNALAAWAAIGLSAVVGLLLAVILARRGGGALAARRLGRVRPGLEAALIDYLAGLGGPPDARDDRVARRALRSDALEMLLELRGEERRRLTTLLEETGIVADTVAELASRSRRTRRRAADALAQFGSTVAADALLAALRSRDASVRLAAARGLAELGAVREVDRLVEVAAADAERHPGLVAELLLALARTAPATLGDILESGSGELRRLAASVVGELRLAEHAAALRDAMTSDDDELAARAARGCGLIGDVEAVEPLLALLGDRARPWFVRAAAAKALGEVGGRAAVPALERALASDEWWLQSNAAEALAALRR